MQQDIGDLLGLEGAEPQWESELNGERRKKGKKKSAKEKVEPPLISFDEDPVATPIPTHNTIMEESPRTRRKGRTGGGGYGSTGYGSTGYGSTKTASAKTGSKAEDWSGDWGGEDWLGGHTEPKDTSGSKSSGWDDWNSDGWNTESGWTTVDLKKD